MKVMMYGAGFDIETTRVSHRAYMYHWQFALDDAVVLGRTWSSFFDFLEHIQTWADHHGANIIIWVANLSHEFAFLCHRMEWKKVFAVDQRQPLSAQSGRIIFRECLSISGKGGLKGLAKHFTVTQKLTGDLDYSIMRNSQTTLTPAETQYCINDVAILSEFGARMFDMYTKNRLDIPYTITGVVRNAILEAAKKTGHIKDIHFGVKTLFPPKKEWYDYIMRYLFRGGYVHANCLYGGVEVHDVIGVDFTSSYPACMLHDYYPMSRFIQTNLKHDGKQITDDRLQTMCCYMRVTFYNISRTTMHAIESEHKIIAYDAARFDNGRLYDANRITVLLTELDYQIYQCFYTWDKIEIDQCFVAHRGSLPNYLLTPLKTAYMQKQTIKKWMKANEIKEETDDYRNAKTIVNSIYGCTVTRMRFTDHTFLDGKWCEIPSNKIYANQIEKQLLSPYWGIWVTAHARHHLLSTVYQMDHDPLSDNVIYCDTDSIYFRDTADNRAVIAAYNAAVAKKNAELPEEFSDLGCFDYLQGGVHYRFKTLGAKRYIKYDGAGHTEVTVSGMVKGTLEQKILSSFRTDDTDYPWYETDAEGVKHLKGYVNVNKMFRMFNNYMVLTTSESLKHTAVYSPDDEVIEDLITDPEGHTEKMSELSCAAIVDVPFQIKMEDRYMSFIKYFLERRRIPYAEAAVSE